MLDRLFGSYKKKVGLRRFLTVFVLLLALLSWFCLFLIYWAVVHPVVSTLFFPMKKQQGAAIYTDGTYLNYEDGEHFQKVIESLSFVDMCTVADFYYCDGVSRDNPIHGKMFDTYSLELQAGDHYNAIKEDISSKYRLEENWESYVGDYNLYSVEETIAGSKYTVYLATNDSASTVRCIMLTSQQVSVKGMWKYSGLNWGQGDGLREP